MKFAFKALGLIEVLYYVTTSLTSDGTGNVRHYTSVVNKTSKSRGLFGRLVNKSIAIERNVLKLELGSRSDHFGQLPQTSL